MIKKSLAIKICKLTFVLYIRCIRNKSQRIYVILGAFKKKLKKPELASWVLAKANEYFQGRDQALI